MGPAPVRSVHRPLGYDLSCCLHPGGYVPGVHEVVYGETLSRVSSYRLVPEPLRGYLAFTGHQGEVHGDGLVSRVGNQHPGLHASPGRALGQVPGVGGGGDCEAPGEGPFQPVPVAGHDIVDALPRSLEVELARRVERCGHIDVDALDARTVPLQPHLHPVPEPVPLNTYLHKARVGAAAGGDGVDERASGSKYGSPAADRPGRLPVKGFYAHHKGGRRRRCQIPGFPAVRRAPGGTALAAYP